MDSTTGKNLIRDLKQTAKAIGIPEGAAEGFINAALPNIKKSLKNKSVITERDLNLLISKTLYKYHKDFSYVYKIRDIII